MKENFLYNILYYVLCKNFIKILKYYMIIYIKKYISEFYIIK